MENRALENVSILCVDNYIDTLELLKFSLEVHGARVHTAVAAEEAVRLFVQHRPEMVICDLAMPHGDGISLLKAIRSMAPLTEAIALTGISDPEVRQEALNAGFDHYFVKPVDDDVLVQTLTRLAMARKLSS